MATNRLKLPYRVWYELRGVRDFYVFCVHRKGAAVRRLLNIHPEAVVLRVE